MPHGYGYQPRELRLQAAAQHPGTSTNDLTSDTRRDAQTHNLPLSDALVRV